MSVYKDEKTGKWYWTARIKNSQGRTVQKKVRGFTTKRDATASERHFFASECIFQEEQSNALFKDLVKHFLDRYNTANKRRSAYTTKNIIDLHILPVFGKKKIRDISSKDILDWQSSLMEKQYSTNYMQRMHTLLSGIFIHGIKYFDVQKNPCQVVGNVKHKEKREMLFWTIHEFNQFLKVVDDFSHAVLFNALFWTGMRKGELLALRWNDIDLDEGLIHITKTLSNDGKNGWELTAPKTKTSKRDVMMTSSLKQMLKDLFNRNIHSVAFNKDFFIFGTYKPMSFTTLDRIYNKYISISSVKRIRIHDFRHSFASALIELGVDIMLLAQMLGHSSREQIFNTYGHLYPNKQKEAISLLENCCQNVANSNSGIKKAPKIGTSSKMVEIRGIEK